MRRLNQHQQRIAAMARVLFVSVRGSKRRCRCGDGLVARHRGTDFCWYHFPIEQLELAL